MNFRRTTISKTNAVQRDVKPVWRLVLEGRVLSIDPSIGSASSLPGYAISVGGVVTESGVIKTGGSKSTHHRLYELGRSLREDFAWGDERTPWVIPDELVGVIQNEWDVLIVEDVPAKRWGKTSWGMRGSVKQQVQLHRAVGAIHASVLAKHCVCVHPATWHTVAPAGYVKSDEGDARCMLELVRQYADHFRRLELEPKQARVTKRRGKK